MNEITIYTHQWKILDGLVRAEFQVGHSNLTIREDTSLNEDVRPA